jgi:hypothetical protein
VESDRSEASPNFGKTSRAAARELRHGGGFDCRVAARAVVAADAAASAAAPKIRRLIDGQRYFGLDALALHAGAGRVLKRLAAQTPHQLRLDIRCLAEDFRLDAGATSTLLTALLVGGLMQPDGAGAYRPTRRFREYAAACVVKPLSRARAKSLVGRANQLAAQINADWTKNPFQIQKLAVSGSYMSRRDSLPELSLSLVLRRRVQVRGRRGRPSLTQEIALRQIAGAMKALSSFVVVHLTADVQAIPRPFIFVFDADEGQVDHPMPAWEKLREWSVSISRRLAK